MNDTTQTLVRSVLKIGAGWLIAKGMITDSQALDLVGAMLGLVGVIWGIAHRKGQGSDQGSPVQIKLFLAVCCAAVGLLCNGCAPTNVSELVKAAAVDKASWSGRITTLYGSAYWVRIGELQTNQSATVSPDGTLSIKSQ